MSDQIHAVIAAAENFQKKTKLNKKLFGIFCVLTNSMDLKKAEAISLLRGDMTIDQAIKLHSIRYKKRLNDVLQQV